MSSEFVKSFQSLSSWCRTHGIDPFQVKIRIELGDEAAVKTATDSLRTELHENIVPPMPLPDGLPGTLHGIAFELSARSEAAE